MFNNSIDVYNHILEELNKEFSPSFETWNYEAFLNKAIYEWIKLKHKEFELTQKRTEDLQIITTRDLKLEVGNDLKTDLPVNHLFLLGVRGEIFGTNKCDTQGVMKPIFKYTTDIKGYSMLDFYATKKNFYEVSHDQLILTPQSNPKGIIPYILIDYIEDPGFQMIDIDDISSPKNSLIPLLKNYYITLEIIKICVTLFLESIEQPRTQGYTQINNQLLTN